MDGPLSSVKLILQGRNLEVISELIFVISVFFGENLKWILNI
ncbi:hypothetical protein SOVF_157380 [Spinacia oleracea]|nr:hypothetical protein SOVF_157380 [Spinacia oleracea]